MSGTLVPVQNFDHLLDPISGFDGMHDLQFHAAVATSEVFERGSVISLDSNGDFVAGAADTDMPMWAINSTSDFDVASDEGNISGGTVAAFVATGGLELVTTEFLTSGTYNPNQLLQASTGGNVGLIEPSPANPLDVLVVGVVSRGVFTEVYNQQVVQFWPVYIPQVLGNVT